MAKKLRLVEVRRGTAVSGWRIEEYDKRTKKWDTYKDDYSCYEWDRDDASPQEVMEEWERHTQKEESVVIAEAEVV